MFQAAVLVAQADGEIVAEEGKMLSQLAKDSEIEEGTVSAITRELGGSRS